MGFWNKNAGIPPGVLAYEGFDSPQAAAHLVHRRKGERIPFALEDIENGGTSPTNMIQDLARAMWQRFYPENRFDRLEWFDPWPEHCSLTNHFHISARGFPAATRCCCPLAPTHRRISSTRCGG